MTSETCVCCVCGGGGGGGGLTLMCQGVFEGALMGEERLDGMEMGW